MSQLKNAICSFGSWKMAAGAGPATEYEGSLGDGPPEVVIPEIYQRVTLNHIQETYDPSLGEEEEDDNHDDYDLTSPPLES